jgi:hypothetical protein
VISAWLIEIRGAFEECLCLFLEISLMAASDGVGCMEQP